MLARWMRYWIRIALVVSAGVLPQISGSCNDGQFYIDIPGVIVIGQDRHDDDDDDWCFGCGGGWFYDPCPYCW